QPTGPRAPPRRGGGQGGTVRGAARGAGRRHGRRGRGRPADAPVDVLGAQTTPAPLARDRRGTRKPPSARLPASPSLRRGTLPRIRGRAGQKRAPLVSPSLPGHGLGSGSRGPLPCGSPIAPLPRPPPLSPRAAAAPRRRRG